ncbi:transposase [Amphibacillus xylanus]|uniref:transposase n=1 Tax=Amphibacillus xylanus TaxID=1449 RepID=UPI0009D91E29
MTNGFFHLNIHSAIIQKSVVQYIQNSFIHTYNNGRIEGINYKIKLLSKVAYGYRNFYNFKKRIMIHFKFKVIETNSSKKMQKETRYEAAI